MALLTTVTIAAIAASTAFTAQALDSGGIDPAAGSYVGWVAGTDYSEPVVTEWIVTPAGELVGSYAIVETPDTETENLLLGVLTNCTVTAARTVRCIWLDRYGEGTLEVSFAETYDRFEGQWRFAGESEQYLWTDERPAREDALR